MRAVRLWGASLLLLAGIAPAQQVDWPSPRLARPKLATIGPYNAAFVAGGDGIVRPVQGYAEGESLPPAPRWTLSAWIKPERASPGRVIVGGVGATAGAGLRALALIDGRPALLVGDTLVTGPDPLPLGQWYHLAATSEDGAVRLLLDGQEIAHGAADAPAPLAVIAVGPRIAGEPVFTGRVADLTYMPQLRDAATLRAEAGTLPNEDLVAFEDASPSWPLQIRTQYGEAAPQRAWTLPKGKAPFSKPKAIPVPVRPALAREGDGRFRVNGWRMAEAPQVSADGGALSRAGFDAARWYAATVPGTALTTLVDRGVYPDPRIGLNNMAIPERLARQDYWYRTEFTLPADQAGKRLTLIFNGINYAASVWVNGTPAGDIKGAFIRGQFDVTRLLVPGQRNAVAVRVSPPPHPGIPHEQSMTAGRGENGGAMQIDGPTFHASESWDWIPGIRDRNTGLWQSVDLAATDVVTLGDPQVVTTLPDSDHSVAEVEIGVPVTNHGSTPLATTIRAAFDDVAVEQPAVIPAGATVTVTLKPAAHPQLRVVHPRLWWPNGYGDPALHTLRLSATADGRVSDSKQLRFGMRQVTYELSSLDSHGDLRRIEVDLAKARRLGTPIIDERHQSLRKVAGGWADSLFPGAETSPAVTPAHSDPRLSPHLVLHVNGVPIAARGGNWGMDEMMKRVEPERLEPYFRLHRDANMNIVRNWMGQSTEEAFYALADQYGIMVMNDFWESTQDNDAEAEDVPLFVANARDTVRRFRNHPSIVLWIGRNEGVPQPILQTALQDLIWQEDGTRMYKGNSRIINFAGSGPYDWREPAGYFTDFARGFAVEVGTYSFPTREAWARAVPAEDRWPINDTWAYHDWHQERAVAVTSFMDALATCFGAGTDLADFERKAQMLNYESHRAIFEGFNAGLWTTNSARMLWMTHPTWPSTDFQIYSSDYDTHGSFYGTRKGAEPIHVQMNLPDRHVLMVNTTRAALTGVTVRAHAVTLDNRNVATVEKKLDVPANGTAPVMRLDLDQALAKGPVLVRLEALDQTGRRLSDNFYWQAADPAAMRALTTMPQASLRTTLKTGVEGGERTLTVDLTNAGSTPAIQAKLTLFDSHGQQILPAYFSDNYLSLLPGESREITIRYPRHRGPAVARLRAWNMAERTLH
ncbi:LamG-like jellyroll fold domain-containing protein [uncultured Sphingomonas sp.]|uniref:glycosyl hydrolase 2 galactose-binding domain-containing protein n=1 Tax=uncultured Sphingomonas sp. TaxID=158754 RepID=UPI0025E344A9|nr:LamG-like jellyroll fold domain-containing protein [uncultured Sphingomonas sp.]